MGYFGKFQKSLSNIAVWYLRQKHLGSLLEAVGLVLDGATDGMLQGMRRSMPLRARVDALPTIALDRSIPLYPDEPDPSQRDRLAHSWQHHKARGSHQGEMRHAQPYFLPGVPPTFWIVHQDGNGATATWHKLAPSGRYTSQQVTPSNFNYDGRPSLWSRFWVFVDMTGTGIAGPPLYDDGHLYDDGSVYDGAFTPAQIADLVAMFQDWHAAHSWLAGIIVFYPPYTIDPTATPTQDADGRWSLPNGANTWAKFNKRPIGYEWIYDNPVP